MPFPVVGIGASAGGLEAFSELLANLPTNTGMAFLLAQHLDPTHTSFLVEILSKQTGMPIEEAREGVEILPDHVYVLPPNNTLTLAGNLLHLKSRETIEQRRSPVDILFDSLAERGPNAIGVILSGSGSDGAKGVQTLKEAGGIIFAEEESSARFFGMPKSAIETGCVDFVLSSSMIAHELVRMGRHPYFNTVVRAVTRPEESEVSSLPHLEDEDQFKKIFRLLRHACGVDFTHYKRTTIERRLIRRMAVHQTESLASYGNLLQENPSEVQALFHDLLIRVTNFFRDPEMFQALAEGVFPRLLADKTSRNPLRIWVPGCASGEEVYSVAICLHECMANQVSDRRIQIFGTDLSDAAIDHARAGYYLDNISADVSTERLERFFTKVDDHYQIAKSIRDLCVFAQHNLIRDPPFSRLDLISCRNVLIYLDQALHRRVLSLFHYALKPHGFLVLGPSETVSQSAEFFEYLGDGHRIYVRKDASERAELALDTSESPTRQQTSIGSSKTFSGQLDVDRMLKESDRVLLSRYAPACVLVDEDLNILQFRGETSLYLEHMPGPATLNLQKLARPSLLVVLSTAISQVRKEGGPVRREGISLEAQGATREMSLEVIQIRAPEANAPCYLILFEKSPHSMTGEKHGMLLGGFWNRLFGRTNLPAAGRTTAQSEGDRDFQKLKQELEATRDFLQATIEEQEAAKEELKSAHEELLSANEEFQTTNEELETAKEELQATNEELITTNDELRHRNRELNQSNDALRASRDYAEAIIATVREPLLILNQELRVVRANRGFYEFFNTRPEETENRRLYEIGEGQWNNSSLRAQLEEIVPRNTSFCEFEMVKAFPQIGEKALLLQAHRLPSDEQRGELILLAIDDITDRRALEESRRAEREHVIEEQASDIRGLEERDNLLKAADRHKNEFLAMLAHELRNPLAPIRTTLDVLRASVATDSTLEWGWNVIDRQTQHLIRLVDDLLDVARFTRGEILLQKEPILLREVLDHAVETSRPLIDSRNQTLSSELPSEPVYIDGDFVRLAQVFSNLLNNASKYTLEGGEISLTAECLSDEAVITLTDNGIGISAEVLPHIFEAFAQSDRSRPRSHGGLGLGLALSRRLVELHGGNITANSEGPGGGSQFVVHLPVLREALAKAAESAPIDARSIESSKFRVLVVDDNVDSAEAIGKLLQLKGHDVRCAFDGASALIIAQQFGPHLILLDISLPDMDGYEVLRRLREQSRVSQPVVAAVTGFGQPEDRLRSQEAGFDHHLVKPFGPDVLMALIESLQQK
jgi:two-component system, chemotaxis family, CheB/CheR fusion protein